MGRSRRVDRGRIVVDRDYRSRAFLAQSGSRIGRGPDLAADPARGMGIPNGPLDIAILAKSNSCPSGDHENG